MAVLEAPKQEEDIKDYIRLRLAAKQLGVKVQTIAYYVSQFNLATARFPLDRNAYMLVADYEKIRSHREARQRRRAKEA